jgi:hypothetical protein
MMRLYDKIGVEHKIDLNATEFVLQRRVQLIFPAIHEKILKGDISGARYAMRALFENVAISCKKGVLDRDNAVRRNYGYLDNRAIHIDIGSFSRDDTLKDPLKMEQELIRKTNRLARWLNKHYPELLVDFHEEMRNVIQENQI